jgi:hypothetical protein
MFNAVFKKPDVDFYCEPYNFSPQLPFSFACRNSDLLIVSISRISLPCYVSAHPLHLDLFFLATLRAPPDGELLTLLLLLSAVSSDMPFKFHN